jgi:glycosyltransferase involved in cell wall biosynthesis
MKIAVDARGINWYNGTGIGTYTYNVLKNLFMIDSKNNYHLFWSGEKFSEFENSKTKIIMSSKRHQRFFENFYFPNYINKNSIDLYHIPQNGIGLCEALNCLKIVTIHDLIPYTLPETVGSGYLKKFLEDMPFIINLCDGIITVSQYSKKDILRFFPNFPKDRIFVTPLAADSSFKPLDKEKCKKHVLNRFNFSNDYILYIGGFSSRKNVSGLVKAFKKARTHLTKEHTLVIVGSLKDEGVKIKDLVNELNLNNKVVFTGFIEDNYLPILYNGASLFVYPSLYEGFGLPPLEAMNCGTPVITSKVTSIPEVIDDAGILVDPYNVDELSFSIEKILNDDTYKNNLSFLGYERSKKFSWTNTANLTLNAYESILSLQPKTVN